MALPASATLTTRVPLARLTQARQLSVSVAAGHDLRGLLEPAMLAEAERVAGIERGALALDWSIEALGDGGAEVCIAATGRQYVDSRVETAAAANMVLPEPFPQDTAHGSVRARGCPGRCGASVR